MLRISRRMRGGMSGRSYMGESVTVGGEYIMGNVCMVKVTRVHIQLYIALV